MKGTVTISIEEYDSLRDIKKAMKEGDSVHYSGYSDRYTVYTTSEAIKELATKLDREIKAKETTVADLKEQKRDLTREKSTQRDSIYYAERRNDRIMRRGLIARIINREIS